ncbi:uncharacterized protein pdgfbb isoform X2 [Esox lucius]|nr:uncharacterized protein pdgfbb isoform X2 [Esox lucius]
MLDRSNANFLLWPPCVEVQRCSGCCNSKSLQCVPVVVHTRHLQVMKIQYIEKRPIYSKAIVSVHDHVECRCHPAPRPPPPTKKKPTPRRPHKDNRVEGHSAKTQTKEELHREDELKHNQRHRLEDMLDQPSKHRNTSSEPGEQKDGLERDEVGAQWVRNATRPLGAKERTELELGGDRSVVDDDTTLSLTNVDHTKRNREEARGDSLFDVAEGDVRLRGGLGLGETGGDWVTQTPPPRTHTSKLQQQGDNSSAEEIHRMHESKEGASQGLEQQLSPTEETNQRAESRFNPSQEADQRRNDNETPESGGKLRHTLLEEQQRLEEERKELLLLHRRLDEEKEHLRQQKEEERQQNPQHHRPHHKLPLTPSTAPTPGTMSPTSTQARSTTAGPRPPVRPGPPRKRTRKNNRRRISKAAMRAMLM